MNTQSGTGEMNWQWDDAENSDRLNNIIFDKQLTAIIYLEERDWHICICAHTKYKDKVTFREVQEW